MATKPGVSEILELYDKCIKNEQYLKLIGNWREDERFYELNFKADLKVPQQFLKEAVVVPTARDMVDSFVDNIDVTHARVHVNKKGTSAKAEESMEMERKFYLGLIHATNVISPISPWRQAAKHFAELGLGVLSCKWDADNWKFPPQQIQGESDKDYALKVDKWRYSTPLSLPVIIQAVHPACIIPDPYQGGQLFVFEVHKKLLFDAQRTIKGNWNQWSNPSRKVVSDEVEYITYWDKDYRIDLIDREPILNIKGGVYKHQYGFIPYTLIESGLGNVNENGDISERYVGILRYMKDMLISESRNYTNNDILIKFETMKGGYVTGTDAAMAVDIKQEFGVYWPLGEKDVQLHDWERKMPPQEAYQHLGLTRDYIDAHAGPRSVRGLADANIRSGAQERFRVSQASARYEYAMPAFQNGTSMVLAKCAMLVKNKIPGNFKIWARTPNDEIDVVVKKELLREPFCPYVEFSPISEEDEYRRQDSLVKLTQAGIYTPKFAWTQMNNVDPKKMEREVEKEKIRNSPSFRQMIDQFIGETMQNALQKLGFPGSSSPVMPQQQETSMSPMPESGQRSMVPPIREPAPMDSAQEMENRLAQLRAKGHSGITTQGRGGGGNRG